MKVRMTATIAFVMNPLIVVRAIELGTNRSEHRIERGEDRHGRVAAELEADVDIENEPGKDAHEETRQG